MVSRHATAAVPVASSVRVKLALILVKEIDLGDSAGSELTSTGTLTWTLRISFIIKTHYSILLIII